MYAIYIYIYIYITDHPKSISPRDDIVLLHGVHIYAAFRHTNGHDGALLYPDGLNGFCINSPLGGMGSLRGSEAN